MLIYDQKHWELISGLFNAIFLFKENCGWNMSTGESANFARGLYYKMYGAYEIMPHMHSKGDWDNIFEHAAKMTWGDRHTYKGPTHKEIVTLIECLPGWYTDKVNLINEIRKYT